MNRFDQWASIGVGSTYAARNLIVKNSVLAMAWYMIESQIPHDPDSVLTFWQRCAWRFVEASAMALRDDPNSRASSRVSRLLLTQDYSAGGRRCLDVELFSRALLLRSVRGLFEPGAHPYHNLPFHWIRLSYGFLKQDPRALLLSNCSFAHLHPSTSPFWRTVLQAWGSLPGGVHPHVPLSPSLRSGPPTSLTHSADACLPQPTYQATRHTPPYSDGLWHRSPTRRDPPPEITYSLGAALSLPIGFCPFLAGFLGAPIRDHPHVFLSAASHGLATRVSLSPPVSSECEGAATAFHPRLQALARHSITHVVHLLTGTEAGGPVRLLTVLGLSSPKSSNRHDRLPRWL